MTRSVTRSFLSRQRLADVVLDQRDVNLVPERCIWAADICRLRHTHSLTVHGQNLPSTTCGVALRALFNIGSRGGCNHLDIM